MSQPDFKLADAKIAIIGLGLMGGSLAMALRGKCASLFGIDPHPATLARASAHRTVDVADSDPATLLPRADLLILSAPVPAILDWLERLPALISHPCIVMDMGSTKTAIVESMSRLPERFDPIGGHPLCGREKLSLANADAGLYVDAPFLLTPLERTSLRALSAARQIVEAVGAHPRLVEASAHDRLLASTSHLPFLLSSALTLATPPESAPFIGPGFKSASRLAGTPSSMMLGVLQTNRENVLNALHEIQSQLSEIEKTLSSSDFSKLESILNQAHSSHHSLTEN
ncbi:MAG: prephenate dehydrogenase/arogenate dehydrogenase family protein [Chloroflexi bacterium]|nr:prephenate dehydrogenase/arogenate dehydrogenase family protein [Chloroflexota bacterium]